MNHTCMAQTMMMHCIGLVPSNTLVEFLERRRKYRRCKAINATGGVWLFSVSAIKHKTRFGNVINAAGKVESIITLD